MRFPGFIGPSYTLQSLNVDCQRTVNLYPEINELGTGKEREVAALIGTPGLRLLTTLATGPVRGAFTATNGDLFVVGGNTVYQVSSEWAATTVGTLSTSSGAVSFADNGTTVVIVDGPYGYSFTLANPATSFAQITDENFLGATQVEFIDGYFIFIKPDSNTFFFSPLNAVTPFDALDVGTIEACPDNAKAMIRVQQNLYFLGSETIEVYYDSGDSDNPFQRVQGAVIETGCAASFAVGKIGNAVYFLGQDKDGGRGVFRAQGLQAERISNFALDRLLDDLDDATGARAFVYQQNGHSFFQLSVPGLSTSWCFDTTSNLWHERAYLSQGNYQRHLADCHAFAHNTHVVGDYSNGKLYALELTTYTDNTSPILRERAAPHISKNLKNVFHSSFQLDLESGVGINGSGQGITPQAILQFSNDFGNTWSNEYWTQIGGIGQRLTRAIWRRLGRARDRVYRVRISDPVKVVMLGAEIELEEGLY